MAHDLPSGGGKALMDVDDAALLVLDHQTGFLETVKNTAIAALRASIAALARIVPVLNALVITTASKPKRPRGPLTLGLAVLVPHAVYVPRKGGSARSDC